MGPTFKSEIASGHARPAFGMRALSLAATVEQNGYIILRVFESQQGISRPRGTREEDLCSAIVPLCSVLCCLWFSSHPAVCGLRRCFRPLAATPETTPEPANCGMGAKPQTA